MIPSLLYCFSHIDKSLLSFRSLTFRNPDGHSSSSWALGPSISKSPYTITLNIRHIRIRPVLPHQVSPCRGLLCSIKLFTAPLRCTPCSTLFTLLCIHLFTLPTPVHCTPHTAHRPPTTYFRLPTSGHRIVHHPLPTDYLAGPDPDD